MDYQRKHENNVLILAAQDKARRLETAAEFARRFSDQQFTVVAITEQGVRLSAPWWITPLTDVIAGDHAEQEVRTLCVNVGKPCHVFVDVISPERCVFVEVL